MGERDKVLLRNSWIPLFCGWMPPVCLLWNVDDFLRQTAGHQARENGLVLAGPLMPAVLAALFMSADGSATLFASRRRRARPQGF